MSTIQIQMAGNKPGYITSKPFSRYEVTEWDGEVNDVLTNVEGDIVSIVYQDGICHRVTRGHFFGILQAKNVCLCGGVLNDEHEKFLGRCEKHMSSMHPFTDEEQGLAYEHRLEMREAVKSNWSTLHYQR